MNQTIELELTGLCGSTPIGFMAACGLLRLLNDKLEHLSPKLSWSTFDDWIPVLHVKDIQNKEEFLDLMVECLKKREIPEFEWASDIRVSPEIFKKSIKEYSLNATCHERLFADTFAAYGSELVTDSTKEKKLKPTAFHMTSGRQQFLKLICEVKNQLQNAKELKQQVQEAIFGPWQYNDQHHSLGWDPASERMHAQYYVAPTEEKPKSVRAAIWFAVESLSLFPTAIYKNKLRTMGFTKEKSNIRFVWPIWKYPIGVIELRTLLGLKEIHQSIINQTALDRRGIVATFYSERSEFGQGYAIFRPAQSLFLSSQPI